MKMMKLTYMQIKFKYDIYHTSNIHVLITISTADAGKQASHQFQNLSLFQVTVGISQVTPLKNVE